VFIGWGIGCVPFRLQMVDVKVTMVVILTPNGGWNPRANPQKKNADDWKHPWWISGDSLLTEIKFN